MAVLISWYCCKILCVYIVGLENDLEGCLLLLETKPGHIIQGPHYLMNGKLCWSVLQESVVFAVCEELSVTWIRHIFVYHYAVTLC